MRLFRNLIVYVCFLILAVTTTFADQPDVVVHAENIESSDGLLWEYNEEGIELGKEAYTDRAYVFTVLPDEFIGMPYMKISNDSKEVPEGLEITFDIDKPAYVYIFLIHAIQPMPWLENDYEMIIEKAVNASWSAGYECNVWKSIEPFKDNVTLGYTDDGLGMYCGIVLEAADLAVEPAGKLDTTWGSLKASY